MFQVTLRTLAVAVLALTATAMPLDSQDFDLSTHEKRELTKQSIEAYMAENNITMTEGVYDPSQPLHKRDVPSGCLFDDAGQYRYQHFRQEDWPGIPGTACFGYGTYLKCGNVGDGNWGGEHWDNIQRVVQDQVTKDGMFETSRRGDWFAGHLLPTSAFSNRNTELFTYGLLKSEVKSLEYFWEKDGDKLRVTGDHC